MMSYKRKIGKFRRYNMSKKVKVKANWADPATTAENEKLPGYFKWAWTSRGVSLAVNVLMIMQLTYYCTDMLGMGPTLVGTLLLVSKLFDGVTDLFVGFIIDRTHTKFGKARPYEFFIVFIWLLTIVLYSAPEMSMTAKAVFVFILYTLINSICATVLDGADAVYLARSVRSESNRVSVMSFNGAVIMLLTIALGILMPQLIQGIGATKAGWTVIAASIGIPMGIIGIFRFIFIKEVAANDQKDEGLARAENENKIPIKTGIRCVFQNKYVWIVAGMFMVTQMFSALNTATGTYYFKYIVGNIGLASVTALSSLVTPFVIMFFPLLTKKLGTGKLLRAGAALGVIGYVVRILGGTNLITLTFCAFASSIAILPISMLISIYLIDCMDYGEWKTGVRVEGLLSAVKSFLSKLGSGIASGMVGLIMGMTGYDGTLEVQAKAANTAIVALASYLPTVLMGVLLFLAIIYKLDQQLPQIRAELAERRKTQTLEEN